MNRIHGNAVTGDPVLGPAAGGGAPFPRGASRDASGFGLERGADRSSPAWSRGARHALAGVWNGPALGPARPFSPPLRFALRLRPPVSTLPRLVKSAPTPLAHRLNELRERIAGAARRGGRPPEAIRLVAVVKTVPTERVAEALSLGITDIGENRVQDARARIAEIGRGSASWHMIGHLQRNKAGHAVELFDRVHGVDDLELAVALSRRAGSIGRTLPVMIEVNVAGEATKQGVAPEAALALAEGVAALPHLALDGLMTVGPAVEVAEAARPGFARLRGLRDALEPALGRRLPELSMGMSGDFEVAIEEGSTMVRVGSALFGPRASQ
jgi:PLP dependent protein